MVFIVVDEVTCQEASAYVYVQVPNRHRSLEDEEVEQVMLYWNDGKKQKSIQDLVFDRQPDDDEILTYYRSTIYPAWRYSLVWGGFVALSMYISDLQLCDQIFTAYLQQFSVWNERLVDY